MKKMRTMIRENLFWQRKFMRTSIFFIFFCFCFSFTVFNSGVSLADEEKSHGSNSTKEQKMSLDACLVITLQSNFDIRLARIDLQSQEHTIKNYRSIFDPTSSFSVGNSFKFFPVSKSPLTTRLCSVSTGRSGSTLSKALNAICAVARLL